MANYVPLRKAMERLGMSNKSLRKYADEGKIDAIRNPAGQRLFNVDGYIQKNTEATRIVYTRVSSRHQKDDLGRQKQHLLSIYPDAEFISDIGSGLNFKRKGLQTILERLMQGNKLDIVVAHKDRLARFGFDLIEYLVKYNGGTIVVLEQTIHSPEQELVQDILNILTVFSARVNGLRRYRREIKEDQTLSHKGAAQDS